MSRIVYDRKKFYVCHNLLKQKQKKINSSEKKKDLELVYWKPVWVLTTIFIILPNLALIHCTAINFCPSSLIKQLLFIDAIWCHRSIKSRLRRRQRQQWLTNPRTLTKAVSVFYASSAFLKLDISFRRTNRLPIDLSMTTFPSNW